MIMRKIIFAKYCIPRFDIFTNQQHNISIIQDLSPLFVHQIEDGMQSSCQNLYGVTSTMIAKSVSEVESHDPAKIDKENPYSL